MLCLWSKMGYDQRVIEMNQQLVYQGVLDNCKDIGIIETRISDTVKSKHQTAQNGRLGEKEEILWKCTC